MVEDQKMDFGEQHYFSSYSHFSIHEEMLKDSVRTLSYRDAMYQNRHAFKDKIVLDVGCGTGILSMFAARSGAKHVIGVDMSDIIEKAQEIVDINGFSDKITLLKGKMEEVKLPFPKVDIIVSEWMGYFLLYESMLDSVLWARDKYLVEDGLILPDIAKIYIAGIEDAEYKQEKIGFWRDVYGFDYSPFEPVAMAEPLVDVVELRSVATDPALVKTIDLYTVKVEDLAFKHDYSLKSRRNDTVHAFVAWFDIEFSKLPKVVRFSTGPQSKYTHWKQVVFYLSNELPISTGDKITGTISCKPNSKNTRHLDITISHELQSSQLSMELEGTDEFFMS